MAPRGAVNHFYDPREGGEAFHLEALRLGNEPCEPARTNCFLVCWINSGSGTVMIDAASHSFAAGSLLFFVPYQYVRYVPDEPVAGEGIKFHANFLCVETTPECWVPALGDAQHGFPYLSGAGRLVIKDAIMMGAALVTMADSAKMYLRNKS